MSTIYTILIATIAAQGSGMIQLPKPQFTNKSLEECIAQRRSVRAFKDKALDLQQIAVIMWAGQGITGDEKRFRASPSAGAT